jgi:hypothetical protein
MTPGSLLRLLIWAAYIALAALIGWAVGSIAVFYVLLGVGLLAKFADNQRRSDAQVPIAVSPTARVRCGFRPSWARRTPTMDARGRGAGQRRFAFASRSWVRGRQGEAATLAVV